MTLRAGALRAAAVIAAAPAAAPPAAATAVLVILVRLAFFPRADAEEDLRLDDLRDPPFRDAVERRDFVEDPPRFFDEAPRLFLLDERFFDDDDRLLDELRDRPFFELPFFEDLAEERRFDAAMLCLLLTVSVWGEP